ncbi:hypothetical protein JOM56_004330 [Amanita muscaria]
MDHKSLAKIPFILLATAGLHASNSPPNSRASVGDGAIITSSWERVIRSATSIVYVYKFCLWIAAFAESAVIIATAFPSLPMSETILKYMLFGGNGSHVRLTETSIIALFLSLLGARIRTGCFRELGQNFTFEMAIRKEHELVTTGLYGIVRHPSYTGYLMTTIAVTLLHGARGSWVRESGLLSMVVGKVIIGFLSLITWVVCGALLRRMKEEDGELRKRFGLQWDHWASHVPYRLIPGLI